MPCPEPHIHQEKTKGEGRGAPSHSPHRPRCSASLTTQAFLVPYPFVEVRAHQRQAKGLVYLTPSSMRQGRGRITVRDHGETSQGFKDTCARPKGASEGGNMQGTEARLWPRPPSPFISVNPKGRADTGH